MLQTMPLTAKPGITNYPPAVEVEIFFAGTRDNAKFLALPQTIDGTLTGNALNTPYVDRIFPGTIMGRVSATNKFKNTIIGLTSGAYTSGTTLNVSAATAVEIVREYGSTPTLYVLGSGTSGQPVSLQQVVVSNVNTTSGALTITALANTVVSGSPVMGSDGSQQALTLTCDLNGIKVTDATNVNRIDVYDPMLLQSGGTINDAYIPNWPADIPTRQYLRAQIQQYVGGVTFYQADLGQ